MSLTEVMIAAVLVIAVVATAALAARRNRQADEPTNLWPTL